VAYSPSPNPVHTPGDPARRNPLALVSLLVSLVFPIGVALNVIGALFPGAVHPPGLAWNSLGNVLDLLGIPALCAAIITGHAALRRAARHPSGQAGRGSAITGLTLGYLSLAVYLGVIVFVPLWIATHGVPIRSFP
jgi:hypothetical protein